MVQFLLENSTFWSWGNQFGGETKFFVTVLAYFIIDDWRCDQYRWINQGVAKLPRRDPCLKKMYFDVDTPNGSSKEFQKHCYQLLNDPTLTLIHYLGDDKVAVEFPHGNAKRDDGRNFVRTCPSTISKCKDLVKFNKPNIVYKKEVAEIKCNTDAVPACTPRNLKQVRNLRYQHLNLMQISHDALYNLHEIAYDMAGFIWKINTFPDLLCICGLQEIISECDKVLLLNSKLQLLSYDTTFQLGDFYVSPLVFRHTLFKEIPCMPVMFLIHERKFAETHQEMFKECIKRIPSLKKASCPLVIDREKAIVNAITSEVQSVKLIYCWNHVFRDIQLWCRKHGAPKVDIAVYSDDLFELFHSQSEKEYLEKLKIKQKKWDAAFEEYYMKEIHPDVAKSIGRWVLERCCAYNPYSGVTNNQSEALNRYNCYVHIQSL